MTKLKLDDLLAQPEEAAKRDMHDAAKGDRGPDFRKAVENASPAERKKLRRAADALRRAVKLAHSGHGTQAARLAMGVLEKDPDSALANHVMGVALEELGRLSLALEFYQRSYEKDPNSPDIYQSLSMVAWKLDMLPAAEKFLRVFLQMIPGNVDGTINLAGVLRDQGKYSDAIDILRNAIYVHAEHHDLWNALGTVLIESGDPVQAATFYQESLRLKPDFGRAWNNLAYAHDLVGEMEQSIEAFDKAIDYAAHAKDTATMRHGRALSYLGLGDLERGWAEYDVRLDPNYKDATLFEIGLPRWDGTDPAELKGKTVIMVGEQGLGDEIMFMNAAKDVIEAVGPEGEVRIACTKRLIPLFRRSFPDVMIEPHASAQLEGRDWRVANAVTDDLPPADLWFPMGNACRAFRSSLDAFPQEPFLTADEEAVAHWRNVLAGFGPGLKVGLLWKSLKMTAKRSKYFSAFDAWKPVLQTPGITFVNLQYGDVGEDIARAEKEFGITIHLPPEIDLRNDLDGVAALGKALDVVVGTMNASVNLACSVGGEALVATPTARGWSRLGSDGLPWYPGAKVFACEPFGNWDTPIRQIAAELEARAKKAKKAA
ncbi:tetratricopeptide repeat protein [Hyphobacterium sp. HN65]|uniref:Tetratricopeptide repeat protein n=1 Tax=Hyphobacterium lacteum TaxID=3116575 RepID=A0ABU7LQM3_9PROT|nr:tetratricopeptide repeat protein [Hyphobacterium sp. HN65]MEE2526220.1 tetratricopeptide repeat protein [Hyphobacterium sp. HN65]